MAQSPPPPQPPSTSGGSGDPPRPSAGARWTRWLAWIALLVILGTLILPGMFSRDESQEITYSQFLDQVAAGSVVSVEINNNNGDISGELADGEAFRTTGPTDLPPDDYALLRERLGAGVKFTRPSSSIWGTLLPLLLPVGLLILFFWWMQRRAQGQVGGIMSIGRSRAKTYSTERP
ncbi:MAG: ATP-dependent metallopeptidase FtsH/Yme1/Tma family protein, partial [bacterium]|nr:ATP-dependent metallopeptidase FtsH/Yme1/Tma family protein [bacterium]